MSDHISETASIAPDGGDPSMEDILASIRRIIADDTSDVNSGPMDGLDNEPDHVDLRDLAATPQIHADENSVLVTADEGGGIAESMDLDDILIMDDEDFAADDLEIPSANLFAEVEAASMDYVDVDDAPDDLEAEIAAMIKKRNAAEAITPDILVETDIAEDVTSEVIGDIANIIEISQPPVDPAITQLVDLNAAAADDAQGGHVDIDLFDDNDLSDDDIFSALDLDMDLVFDGDGPEAEKSDNIAVAHEALIVADADESAEELLDMIEESLVGIDAVPADDSQMIMSPLEGTDEPLQDDDTLIDLVGEITEETSPQTTGEDLLSDIMNSDDFDVHTDVPPAEDILAPSADVAGEDDIDLVKSLMAELTDVPLHDDFDIVSAAPEAVSAEPEILPEAQLVDDILELTLDDQALDMDEEAAAITQMLDAPETPAPDALDMIEPDAVAAAAETDIKIEPAATPEVTGGMSLLDIAAAAELDAVAPLQAATNSPQIDEFEAVQHAALIEQSLEIPDAALAGASMTIDKEAQASHDVFEIDALFAETLEFDDASGLPDDVVAVDVLPASGVGGGDASQELVDFSALSVGSVTDANATEPDEVDFDAIFGDDTGLISKEAIYDSPLSASAIVTENFIPDLGGLALSESAALSSRDDLIPDIIDSVDETAPPKETEDMPKLVTKDGILDEITESASAEAFASLNQLVEEKSEYEESGPRIGDLVQDALRPMLKEWLDANLKGIVERAVSKEVKRIASGK